MNSETTQPEAVHLIQLYFMKYFEHSPDNFGSFMLQWSLVHVTLPSPILCVAHTKFINPTGSWYTQHRLCNMALKSAHACEETKRFWTFTIALPTLFHLWVAIFPSLLAYEWGCMSCEENNYKIVMYGW